MSHRIEQINELLKSHLGEIFSREIDFKPEVFITITRVETSADLRQAKVFVSVFPETEEAYALRTIGHEKRKLQKELYAKLYMKPLPRLFFEFDPIESKADDVEKILKDIERGA